jgi:hypothetical protein
MKALLAAVAVAVAAAAGVEAASLRELVKGSLEQGQGLSMDMEVEVGGVNNCQNKCYTLLGYLSYATAKKQMATAHGNNEFRACMLGCDQCLTDQANNVGGSECFDFCKGFNYGGENPPIIKGVIEPDKACIIGCVIQLCQVVCTGANPWQGENAPGGGCQIQTGFGITTYDQGDGGAAFAACCKPLSNLCTYQGTIPNPNYNSILHQTYQTCSGSTIGGVTISPTTSTQDLCDAYQTSYTKKPIQCGAPQPLGG